jgi:hypothetical protein
MRKALPDKMFLDDQARLSLLRNWCSATPLPKST